MIDRAAIGASVTMTPQEVHKLVGDEHVRLVTCPNGRIVGGVGAVGLVEHMGDSNLTALIEEIAAKRAALKLLAEAPPSDNPRSSLYTFIRI